MNYDVAKIAEARRLAASPPRTDEVAIILMVRMASQRFQGKVILPLSGKPAWWHIIKRAEAGARLAGAKVKGACLVFPTSPENDILEIQARAYGYDSVRHDIETDVIGHYMQALDYYGVDIGISPSGDSPLSCYEHLPLLWPGVMRNHTFLYHWGGPWPKGDPGLYQMHNMFGVMGVAYRWQWLLYDATAQTPQERQVSAYILERDPSVATMIQTPVEWVKLPQEMFDLYRPWKVEVDIPEDGLVVQILYNQFWDGKTDPYTPVDVRKCVQFIDDNPWYLYNRERIESAVNQHFDRAKERDGRKLWLDYCEACLVPAGAKRLRCVKCGEYLGFVTHDHGLDSLHRPDGTVLAGSGKIACDCGYAKMWRHNWPVTVAGGSAVMV